MRHSKLLLIGILRERQMSKKESFKRSGCGKLDFFIKMCHNKNRSDI